LKNRLFITGNAKNQRYPNSTKSPVASSMIILTHAYFYLLLSFNI